MTIFNPVKSGKNISELFSARQYEFFFFIATEYQLLQAHLFRYDFNIFDSAKNDYHLLILNNKRINNSLIIMAQFVGVLFNVLLGITFVWLGKGLEGIVTSTAVSYLVYALCVISMGMLAYRLLANDAKFRELEPALIKD